MTSDAFITEFCATLSASENTHPFFVELPRDIVEKIHQRTDLSAVYYAPGAVFAKLEATLPVVASTFSQVRRIPVDCVILFHCGTYVQRYDYLAEEANMKAILLSKGYDIGICTGRAFTRHYCSDLMYTDRFFSYRFGDRKYWFACYSSSTDTPELISDKLGDLFGSERGPEVFAKLGQLKRHKSD